MHHLANDEMWLFKKVFLSLITFPIILYPLDQIAVKPLLNFSFAMFNLERVNIIDRCEKIMALFI
jgi:hypothetical protein